MLLDNKTHGKVVDELRAAMSADSKMLVLTGWFSVFGYSALKSELGKVQELRILLTRPDSVLPLNLAGTSEEIGQKNDLNLQRIAAECADWVRKKAQVRHLAGAPIAQNIFHIQPPVGEAVAVAVASVPAAFLGGLIDIPPWLYRPLVGVVLLFCLHGRELKGVAHACH